MALREIREDGDEILRKVSKPVEEVNEKIKGLIDDMLETMHEKNGVGLAAPQVGILKRIVVIDVGEGPVELINPKILCKEGEQIGPEGCLSIPNVYGEVKRPNYVRVEGLNRNGEKVTYEGKEMFARAVCHELDHLEGILFKDKVIRYLDMEGRKKK